MKLIIATVTAAIVATTASAWPVKDMNDTINSVNFIVNKGCSGTLISKKYRLILTNHHCIDGAVNYRMKEVVTGGVVSKVRVEELRDLDVAQRSYDKHQLVGSSTYKAEVVARWKESDLALLQVRADVPNGIEAKVFAGDQVFRGETVYAVGNPLGLDATVMKGVISSTTRMFRVGWADAEVSFIQIDAGITGGNSGGSLFNNNGELIGVPAAGVPGTVLGLAIPFFRVQEFLTKNCYGSVWDVNADDYDTCVAEREAGDS